MLDTNVKVRRFLILSIGFFLLIIRNHVEARFAPTTTGPALNKNFVQRRNTPKPTDDATAPSSLSTTLSVRGGKLFSSSTASVDSFLNSMDLLGTAVFAFSGALTAGKMGMDLLGMTIVATITSCGGGTLRDLLLDAGPAFWMTNAIYLQICVGVAWATFLFWPALEQKMGWKGSEVPVCTADAVGLAAFAVLGAQKAAKHRLHPLMWIVSGLMSACFGGVIRDLICLQRPRIMYPERTMYSPGPIIGSALYAALVQYTNLETQMIASIAFLATFVVRVGAFNNSMRLPHWK